ncbi:MAG TPA: hypothetical protein VL727_03270 [Puia sp.]|nr:hypothetical protein [Puia sp.]
MERRYDNNPWADKLSQVTLPDGGEAWKAMELLLDKEMPVGKQRDKRRWILLLLLLLLLIGVCNCPGRGRLFGDRPVAPVEQEAKDLPENAGGGLPERANGDRREHVGGDTLGYADRGIAGHDGPGTEEKGRGIGGKGRTAGGKGQATGGKGQAMGGKGQSIVGKGRGAGRKGSGVLRGHRGKIAGRFSGDLVSRGGGVSGGDSVSPGDGISGGDSVSHGGGVSGSDSVSSGNSVPGKDSTLFTKKATSKKDSLQKASAKPAPKPAEEKEQKEKGWWTAGIGLNQFFTVGGQQASQYNSGGISGTLGDYIPVPVIQYHFNRKFYLQLEAQFNSPQYTKKDLVISRPPLDSLSPVQKRQSTVFIKKLFYFNLPLSIHYNVYRGLNLGAGLQFSRLSNGFGLYQDQYLNSSTGGIDTTTAVAKSVKGDSLYKRIKTDELRFLFDASYTWKHFIFGIRYNQALSKFINVQITPGEVTQGRNSSLQLYMRYILWDNRKKPADLTK